MGVHSPHHPINAITQHTLVRTKITVERTIRNCKDLPLQNVSITSFTFPNITQNYQLDDAYDSSTVSFTRQYLTTNIVCIRRHSMSTQDYETSYIDERRGLGSFVSTVMIYSFHIRKISTSASSNFVQYKQIVSHQFYTDKHECVFVRYLITVAECVVTKGSPFIELCQMWRYMASYNDNLFHLVTQTTTDDDWCHKKRQSRGPNPNTGASCLTVYLTLSHIVRSLLSPPFLKKRFQHHRHPTVTGKGTNYIISNLNGN